LWAALFAVVMPITDGLLAYQAHAPLKVILKHIATIIYLLATSAVLQMLVRKQHRN
jgi:heme A synthase